VNQMTEHIYKIETVTVMFEELKADIDRYLELGRPNGWWSCATESRWRFWDSGSRAKRGLRLHNG
jgi:hypothetical protein